MGPKNDATVRAIQDKLQNLVEADDGSRHLENVKIITSEQYGEFLGFNNPVLSLNDKGFKQRFDNYQELSHNEDWMNIYRPQ